MYITTAIDYVNAKPHIGHAFEKVLADAIARFHRLNGENVYFLTGTDENATKNVQAAKAANLPVQTFIDQNAQVFIDLCKSLNLSNDRFIRTSEAEHHHHCQLIFQQLFNKGYIYKGFYKGLYCPGCEAYVTEKDLVNGNCPEHDKPPIATEEECYFFKIQEFVPRIKEFVETHVIPKFRANEILVRLEEPVLDLPVSRKNTGWGIPTPVDSNHTIYVWFDALINYWHGGWGEWPPVHVIGKGINWFHSVIWPAMLFGYGAKLPKSILVHGYLNLGGKKISKSLGNTIDPQELIARYGTDAVRYSLLRCSTFQDADYSEDLLVERYNTDLANKFGNLVSRVATLVEKYGTEPTDLFPIPVLDTALIELFDFQIDKMIAEIMGYVESCNEYIDKTKPWETKDKKALYKLLNAIKDITILLWPFIPGSCEIIAKKLGFEIDRKSPPITTCSKIQPVFKRIGQ